MYVAFLNFEMVESGRILTRRARPKQGHILWPLLNWAHIVDQNRELGAGDDGKGTQGATGSSHLTAASPVTM